MVNSAPFLKVYPLIRVDQWINRSVEALVGNSHMKNWATLLVMAVTVCSCQSMPRNVRTFPIQADGCREFIVVVQDWHYPIGFVDREGNLTMITSGLDTLGQIESIRPSPGSTRVLIESYGEGHQFLSIYDVAVLIGEEHASTEMLPAVRTLDPYPYGFHKMKWIDDNTLQFDSVSDFNHFDTASRRGKYSGDLDDETVRTWKWKIAEDRFEEIGSQHPIAPPIQNPLRGFLKGDP
jgi:hypothetical protein